MPQFRLQYRRSGLAVRCELLSGEAVDFWRVERVVENRLLRLRAEMKTPGKAWLEFEAIPEGRTLLPDALKRRRR